MTPPTEPSHASPSEPRDAVSTEAEVIAFARDRSVPCPRCGYDLQNIQHARCPECGDDLVLRIGSARPRFGWLILSMAPGCFSGVAAVMLVVPIYMTIGLPAGRGTPVPVMIADAFGFVSAASVFFMYRSRHRLMALRGSTQMAIAGGIWMTHILAFALVMLAMWLFH